MGERGKPKGYVNERVTALGCCASDCLESMLQNSHGKSGQLGCSASISHPSLGKGHAWGIHSLTLTLLLQRRLTGPQEVMCSGCPRGL